MTTYHPAAYSRHKPSPARIKHVAIARYSRRCACSIVAKVEQILFWLFRLRCILRLVLLRIVLQCGSEYAKIVMLHATPLLSSPYVCSSLVPQSISIIHPYICNMVILSHCKLMHASIRQPVLSSVVGLWSRDTTISFPRYAHQL